uniref:WW domain-containing protein n=1 Tax=Noctiluca scintillans TaxID=2966 RepID=A0A7S1AAH5_NOCSC
MPLYEDADGALPRPWVAFETPDPPNKGSLYYHNLVTFDTKWERPEVHVPRHAVYGNALTATPSQQQQFVGWRDEMAREIVGASAGEAEHAFRNFCVRLLPRGVFGRRGDGMLWRLGEGELVGLTLYPEQRRLVISYDPQYVSGRDVAAAGQGTLNRPTDGLLSAAAKVAALEVVQRSLLSRQTALATLVMPDAHLLRRYVAEMGVRSTLPRPSAEVLPLATYLESFRLVPPFTCRLTGVANIQSCGALAAHILCRSVMTHYSHLKTSVQLLAHICRGDVALSEWLPLHVDRYRVLLDWSGRRFQNLPMADGKIFRFDFLRGLGTLTPASCWHALGQSPPSLSAMPAPTAVQDVWNATTRHIWSTSADGVPSQSSGSLSDLLAAVKLSLGPRGDHGSWDDGDDLEPPWEELRSSDGQVYYYNTLTRVTTWERLGLRSVEVGELWASNPKTRAHDTPAALYERYHRIAPKPQRDVALAVCDDT